MGQLKLASVTKNFGTAEVIKPTDLSIEEGEFAVFVGPSGCGKSTMLRMIAGLEEVTSGSIEIDGKRINDLPPVKRGISMVFQSYALYPHMTVYENIAFPLRVARLPKDEVDRLVLKAADVLKLRERLDHKPGALSGGQRQRVAIGRAIVREPQIFLFDEPLSNLDAALRAEMRVELSRLHNKLGNTMIYVTHDQVEAMTMADKIVVLRDGRIEQVGSPLELFHKPKNRFVAGFIGTPNMNFLPVSCKRTGAEGVTIALPNGGEATIPVPPAGTQAGQELVLGIRPDDLHPAERAAGVRFLADVVERLGNQAVIYGNCEGADMAQICMIADGAVDIRPGQALDIGFDPAKAHLFTKDGEAFDRQVDLRALAALA